MLSITQKVDSLAGVLSSDQFNDPMQHHIAGQAEKAVDETATEEFRCYLIKKVRQAASTLCKGEHGLSQNNLEIARQEYKGKNIVINRHLTCYATY